MFVGKSKQNTKVCKSKGAKATKRKSSPVLKEEQPPITKNRVTLPYNVLGNTLKAVSSVTVHKNISDENKENCGVYTAQATTLQNEVEIRSTNLREQVHFKGVSDYYAKLQERKSTKSGSVFKEINTRFQCIAKDRPIKDNNDFCKKIHTLRRFKPMCDEKFSSSILKIKNLVNAVNNNLIINDATDEEVVVHDDVENHCDRLPLLVPPERFKNSTPRNKRTELPTIKSTVYEPCIRINSNSRYHSYAIHYEDQDLPHLSSLSKPSNHFSFRQAVQANNKNCINEVFGFNEHNYQKSFNFGAGHGSANDSYLKIDESILVPKVPELREPSPLKFYPRKVFTVDS